ncbi:hypothetical protein [Pseudomonas koreensis]|uniref:hypothetical protein n=1 Tax=Pseudomonas koreensis TaxID=198620 RepID=UPI002076FC93|nr:hypothetical protein [Pseudomonas koreensis]MCM8740545.1 hypothetical protein [Pseudomonas koreensis]
MFVVKAPLVYRAERRTSRQNANVVGAENNVGAAEGCDLLILNPDQKIAAFGSSYMGNGAY